MTQVFDILTVIHVEINKDGFKTYELDPYDDHASNSLWEICRGDIEFKIGEHKYQVKWVPVLMFIKKLYECLQELLEEESTIKIVEIAPADYDLALRVKLDRFKQNFLISIENQSFEEESLNTRQFTETTESLLSKLLAALFLESESYYLSTAFTSLFSKEIVNKAEAIMSAKI